MIFFFSFPLQEFFSLFLLWSRQTRKSFEPFLTSVSLPGLQKKRAKLLPLNERFVERENKNEVGELLDPLGLFDEKDIVLPLSFILFSSDEWRRTKSLPFCSLRRRVRAPDNRAGPLSPWEQFPSCLRQKGGREACLPSFLVRERVERGYVFLFISPCSARTSSSRIRGALLPSATPTDGR